MSRVEGVLEIIQLQPLCHGKGHLSLSQVALSPIQAGLEYFQGWDSHSFSGQPVTVPLFLRVACVPPSQGLQGPAGGHGCPTSIISLL